MDVTRIYNALGTTRILPPTEPARSIRPTPRRSSASHEDDGNSFGAVYVNEAARHALIDERTPRFPVGSVIVREKLARALDVKPQLVIAMVKRERGFNPKANDWEFVMLDGNASTIRHREKTGSCQKCHAQQKQSDFVFRTYLPEELRLKQR